MYSCILRGREAVGGGGGVGGAVCFICMSLVVLACLSLYIYVLCAPDSVNMSKAL